LIHRRALRDVRTRLLVTVLVALAVALGAGTVGVAAVTGTVE